MCDPGTRLTMSGTLPRPARTPLSDDMMFTLFAAHMLLFALQVDRIYDMLGRHDSARHSAARARDDLLDLANNLRAVAVNA